MGLPQWILNPLRLPIPPQGLNLTNTIDLTGHFERARKINHKFCKCNKNGKGDLHIWPIAQLTIRSRNLTELTWFCKTVIVINAYIYHVKWQINRPWG